MAIFWAPKEDQTAQTVSQNLQSGINLLINQKMEDLAQQRKSMQQQKTAERLGPAIKKLMAGEQVPDADLGLIAQHHPQFLQGHMKEAATAPARKADQAVMEQISQALQHIMTPNQRGQELTIPNQNVPQATLEQELGEVGQPTQAQATPKPEDQVAALQAAEKILTASANQIRNPQARKDLLKQAQIFQADAQNIIKNQLASQKVQYMMDKPIHQYNLDSYKTWGEDNKVADETLNNYGNMINLALKGDIKTGPAAKITDLLGLTDILKTPSEDLVDKYMASQAQQVPKSFQGARGLTDFKEKQFIKSVGSRLNTDRGLIALGGIRQMAALADKDRYKIASEIRKQAGGRFPLEYTDEVYNRWEPSRKKYEGMANFITRNVDNIYIPEKKKPSKYKSPERFPMGIPVETDKEILYPMGSFWIVLPKGKK